MVMLKGLFFFLNFFLLIISSYGQVRLDEADRIIIKQIELILESREIKFHQSTAEIPQILFQDIRKENKDFSIADFGEKFNKTDLIEDEIPMRGIKFIASSGDFWIIAYAHGGFALHNHIGLFKISGETIEDEWTCSTLKPVDSLELIKGVLRKKEVISYKYTDKY